MSIRGKLGWGIALIVSVYAASALALVVAGLTDGNAPADLIVVPGNTVHPDGTPSGRLTGRLDAALDLFNARRAPLIFVSGGLGREGHDEAKVMAAYLLARGVPADAVVQDPLGVDTRATAVNAALYMKAHGLRSALVATQYFHVPRTALALRQQGVEVTGSRYARYVEWRDAYSIAREVPGYVAYVVRDGVSP